MDEVPVCPEFGRTLHCFNIADRWIRLITVSHEAMPFMNCEACEKNAVTVVEACDDPVEPYQVCSACHKRLLARALRPSEWYNLAKRHGWYQYLLHSDFYDEDGRADQPEIDVDEPENHPAPSLLEANVEPEGLLDYSITRWNISPELVTAWSAYPKRGVLETLQKRFGTTKNAGIRGCILEITSLCLGDYGADFVRNAWGYYPEHVALSSVAEASAKCLPHREGYDRASMALALLDVRKKRELMYVLSYFRSPETLDWIEANIIEPVTDSWGYLAASSEVDWVRLKRWLLHGRPLSLVAIDTLRAIQHKQTKALKEYRVRLAAPPSIVELRKALEEYASRDPVPRVRQRVDSILKNYELLNIG